MSTEMIITFTVSIITPDPKGDDIQSDPELMEQMEALRSVFEEELSKAGFELNEAFWEAES